MKKQIIAFILLSVFITGCTTLREEQKEVKSEKIEVVASFYPLYFLAQEIIGERGSVVNLAGDRDIHDYSPSPQDMVKLKNADLVLLQGEGLEPWGEGILGDLGQQGIPTREVAHDLERIKTKNHENHDEDDHEEEHLEDEHDHGEFDPHTWLDPILAQQMTDVIADALIEFDPQGANTYRENTKILKDKFKKLDESYTSQLAQCVRSEVIVSHDAYGYIAQRYGFDTHAIAGLSTGDQPSAKILSELKKEAGGMTHILGEKNNIERFTQTLATETGLGVLFLNPLGQGPQDKEKDFFDVMEDNLSSFSTALGCN